MLLDLSWRLLLRPLLFLFPAERAHRLTLGILGRLPGLAGWMAEALAGAPDPRLALTLGSLRLAGPVGLAAGLDKDGEAIAVWPHLGFGFVEIGTVTALAQPGNPAPRLFRLPAVRGLINRMGFNNHGSDALAQVLTQLRARGRWPRVPVGANIGKSKATPLDEAEADYLLSVERLKDQVDWFTVNVSSPNTPGLRELQRPERLTPLLRAVVDKANPKPVFVKFAPDLEEHELGEAVEVAIQAGCAAIVATNTTNSRPGSTGSTTETGGLSGAPIWPLAFARIQAVLRAASGRIPVIGVGGIMGPEEAVALLDAGCVAVQVYTGLIFEGPGLVARINRALLSRLDRP